MESESSIYRTPKEDLSGTKESTEIITHGLDDILHELELEGFHLEQDPQVAESFEYTYEAFISDPERIIGSGNYAVVFDTIDDTDRNTLCAKGIWSPGLSVGCRNKASGILPVKYERLRTIQRYYELIAEKRRDYLGKNVEFPTQLDPIQEALVTNIANKILERFDIPDSTPIVKMVIEYHRNDEGFAEDTNKSPYMVSENVTFLVMTKFHAKTIEQLILEQKNHSTLKDLDFEAIKNKLGTMLLKLHEYGLYHNDISTRNIMIDAEGKPHLIDFGASEITQPNEDKYNKNTRQLSQVMEILSKGIEDPESAKDTIEDRVGI